jgi:hypothetical protein
VNRLFVRDRTVLLVQRSQHRSAIRGAMESAWNLSIPFANCRLRTATLVLVLALITAFGGRFESVENDLRDRGPRPDPQQAPSVHGYFQGEPAALPRFDHRVLDGDAAARPS